jgi:histone-lysine N-methyltransferase SETD7
LYVEGQYVDGELHGPAHEFNSYGQLVFKGCYKHNVRYGLCCLYDEQGGQISGGVDECGAMTGYDITYWYPGKMVGLQGQFKVSLCICCLPTCLSVFVSTCLPALLAFYLSW